MRRLLVLESCDTKRVGDDVAVGAEVVKLEVHGGTMFLSGLESCSM